jgi:Cytochrome c554 and c-prime
MMRSLRVAVLLMVSSSALCAETEVAGTPGILNPSAVCAECHRQIYAMWRRSMHANSWTDPIFALSYSKAYLETGGKAQEVCVPCHAPGATLSKDPDREAALDDGITCDFCHSVVSVDLDSPGHALRAVMDGVKRGPLADAVSPAHQVAKSELHESAEFCAGCHEYANPNGVKVFSTYSEWQASPQAKEGKVCQDCHMPMTAGQTVKPELGIYREEINLHDISGGHSSEQVRKAASIHILRLARGEPQTALVQVEVANVGSGHAIPTGLPTRKLVLEVVLFVGKREARRFERVYQKVLLDAHGAPISNDHQTIIGAHALGTDNRLRPGERRLEEFTTVVPPHGVLRAEASLRYVYEPELVTREAMSITVGTDRSP